jgi:isoleucyl-tRNA synthetase
VHLPDGPAAEAALIEKRLATQMQLARRLVELGRAARATSRVKTRQPLARALISAPGFEELAPELVAEITDELNVRALDTLQGELVERTVKPNFRSLGRRYGSRTAAVAAAVSAADAEALSEALRGGTASVQVDGEVINLDGDDVVVTQTPREGWAVAADAGETVALDLEITPELRRAGMARDVVRVVQEGRKAAGLDVVDRIELWWQADGDAGVRDAIVEHADWIAAEVLATVCTEGAPAADLSPHEQPELGFTFWLRQAGG